MELVKNKIRRHSTHVFTDLRTADFPTDCYSRMKFGSGADARLLGREMAEAFASEFWDILTTKMCLVIPAPSTTVPVAATLMGWHFHNRLNSLLDTVDCLPVEWDLVHRAVTYNDNYAQLSVAERRKLLEEDERYMNVAFAAGKTLIFVDDVTITGTHEEKLVSMVEGLGLENDLVFATYAEYRGDTPSIEHELNHRYVRDAFDVAAMAQDPLWSVTTRALRIILETPEEHFRRLCASFSPLRLEEVYHASIVKNYSQHEPYARNFATLREQVERPTVGV